MDREELKENLDQLEVPKGMSPDRAPPASRSGRPSCRGPELHAQLWAGDDGAPKAGKGAFLIYQESSRWSSARSATTSPPDIGEILIDTDDIYEQASSSWARRMPTTQPVKRYRDDALLSRASRSSTRSRPRSAAPSTASGGAIVIDHRGAGPMDVNSGAPAKRQRHRGETATRTNLGRPDEIARQMRLRDLGGLIVIDFIDMDESKNRREVESACATLRQDPRAVQFVDQQSSACSR